MIETIGFRIDGAFITDLARTWFWDEHRPIKTCADLIKACCGDIEETVQDEIVREILEGRKKFTGINTFTLEDDNGHIRSLVDKIASDERKYAVEQIRLDMAGNFRKYVDVFATVKSMHISALSCGGMPSTFQEFREYLTMTRNEHTGELEELSVGNMYLVDKPDMGGLWLIHEPETVYDACNGDLSLIGKPEFWRNIYSLKKDDPDFTDRNERYLFSIRPKPSFEERMAVLMKTEVKDEAEPEFETPEWFAYQFEKTKEYVYDMYPDNIEKWEGLIAPNGDFYSCEFGSHNMKAYYLLITHAETFGMHRKDVQESVSIRADNALDFLIDHGWCATRTLIYHRYTLPEKPTREQINRIFDAVIKHNVSVDTKTLMTYYG